MEQPPLAEVRSARSQLTRPMTQSEVVRMFKAAQLHGGSFMRALATAGLAADPNNTAKILRAWPEMQSAYGPGSHFYEDERND